MHIAPLLNGGSYILEGTLKVTHSGPTKQHRGAWLKCNLDCVVLGRQIAHVAKRGKHLHERTWDVELTLAYADYSSC